ncbi:hypothetical protein MPTK1_4g06360 [Marchantia polymorpha subsp. ruderalis]|uniref:Uncharacterized protein n=2 Tax=Marchantia polymorpha TaxID=3197 RepID=A0A176WFB2_MARPO|nr:hypothetical protein AXG93_1838s1170 [Marchantia polymorpha subsp. ruderalis]PTQ31197.1 hypothetical protein MARPO_0114s0017 [Marchantia polymorpha]BBN07775.1 hypothetical protein Mp_4g06360 [Marchantia polymorpha subsp. ruderalis]|eukprot:PTQ31197.1 hypothetical protein MARPO_0114s0017 [Marchantia polymorpha]
MAEVLSSGVASARNVAPCCCSSSSAPSPRPSSRQLRRIALKLHGCGGLSVRRSQPRVAGGTAGVARASKNMLDDPFDFGEDEDLEYGDLMSEGKQGVEPPRPRKDKNSKYGFLDFPGYHNLEIASLGLYVRKDVRRCLCWVAGGVYENLLFFPVIKLLKARYPGVKVDIVTSARGKQVYEMNKYVNKAYAFDVDAEWVEPVELNEFIGVLRDQYYDMVLSTKYAGFKHCTTLYMIGGRTRRISYVLPYHSEWVSNSFLTTSLMPPRENLADGGYHMYKELIDYLAQPGNGVPEQAVPMMEVGVPKRVRAVATSKYTEAGVEAGKFVVFHGVESDSGASMQTKGDSDSLLPPEFWAKLKASAGTSVLVVIPNMKDKKKVIAACGDDVHVVFITTPGQLGAIIRDSAGVVSTNTAAVQIAIAFNKPSVAIFGSDEKASLFVPPLAKKCKVVTSKTGKLADVEVDEAISAWKSAYLGQLALTA